MKKDEEDCYLVPEAEVPYWLSIDSNNGLLRYGIGLVNSQLTVLEAKLKEEIDGKMVWKDPKYSWIEDLKLFQVTEEGSDQVSIPNLNQLTFLTLDRIFRDLILLPF